MSYHSISTDLCSHQKLLFLKIHEWTYENVTANLFVRVVKLLPSIVRCYIFYPWMDPRMREALNKWKP